MVERDGLTITCSEIVERNKATMPYYFIFVLLHCTVVYARYCTTKQCNDIVIVLAMTMAMMAMTMAMMAMTTTTTTAPILCDV